MNICVLGDSHVGSLKRGWGEIKGEYPKHEITFFAQRSDGLDGLIAHDGKLIANNEKLAKALEFTSAGRKTVDPGAYDMFVIYGAGVTINVNDDRHFYSSAVVESGLHDLITNTLSFNLLKRLRTLTDKPVFMGHLPLVPAMEVLIETVPDKYVDRVKRINQLIYRMLNVELVRQPLSTIVNGKNTRSDFSKGSRALAIGDGGDNVYHPESDNHHMNDRFGEIWLREFFDEYLGEMSNPALKQEAIPSN